MARLARSIIVGYPHHLMQRGNYDQPVFEGEADYRRYVDWLSEYAPRYGVEIWAYCLMPNHVHFICVPRTENSLARAFNTLHMRYAQYFNGKRAVNGHLWRARFMSCALDNRSVFEEIRFIENNPVRAGFVGYPEDYQWSSARRHVLGGAGRVIANCFLNDEIKDWRAYLIDGPNETILSRTWQSLKTGRPSGDIDFVRRLEMALGKKLMAMPRGRPRKLQLHLL
jgi:putative transposase